MRRCEHLAVSIALTVLAGCGGNAPQETSHAPQGASPALANNIQTAAEPTTGPASTLTGNDPQIASLGALHINRSELDAPLYKAFGLRMLFDLAELDLAKSTLSAQHLTLDQADIDAERLLLLKKLNGPETDPHDYERGLAQFLEREHLSEEEFQIKAVETNAAFRKLVKHEDTQKLTDADVHKAFDQIYGQKRQIADIQCSTLADASTALRRVSTEPFAVVAADMSTDDETRSVGGVWQQPFSMASPESTVPAPIREAAFKLEMGQVCPDIVQVGDKYHVIKVVDVIDQKIVKYDDVKQSVREQLEDELVDIKIKALRKETTRLTQKLIQINEPEMNRQWQALLDQNAPRTAGTGTIRKNLDRETPTTAPAQRPPATMPGASAPGGSK